MLQSTGGKQAKTEQQQLPNREYLRGGKTRRKINPPNGTILLAEIYTSPSLVHKAVCVHVYEIRKARMQFDKKEGVCVCVCGGGGGSGQVHYFLREKEKQRERNRKRGGKERDGWMDGWMVSCIISGLTITIL